MQVNLKATLSDPCLDINQSSNQRQLAVSIAALADVVGGSQLPLNLGLIIDCSGSMKGFPLEMVKQAAQQLIYQLRPHDRLSVVSFDHQAKTVIPNQLVGADPSVLASKIDQLQAGGGTSIDEGIKLGIKELSATPSEGTAHAFILTDGENEHGDNDLCIKFASDSNENKITLHTLGFGEHWNQNILEKIADIAGGTLAYIEKPENAIAEFARIFNRIQSVGLSLFTNYSSAPSALSRTKTDRPSCPGYDRTASSNRRRSINSQTGRLDD
jgi:Ca-activated chloride channel homolog